MTPATIIQAAQLDGVTLALSAAGTLKAMGDGAAVNRWLEVIREHKAGILEALNVRSADPAIVSRCCWLLHFADRDPLEVWTAPPATHAEVLATYPEALAAEPILEHRGRTATEGEAAELRTLIEAIYADDSDADRVEAMQAAMADPEGAFTCYRAIAVERCISPGAVLAAGPQEHREAENAPAKSCMRCRLGRRPRGLTLLCGGGREDLPPAYGDQHALHRLPDDGGVQCGLFEGWE